MAYSIFDGLSFDSIRILVTDGTAATPSMTFTDDRDTGFYRIASNNIGLALGGVVKIDYVAGAFAFQENITVSSTGTLTLGAVTLGGAVAGGDQSFTGVGDMTFTAGSILASGSTNGNTLLIRANDTTFITLTTGTTDVCTLANITMSGTWIASGTVTMPALTLGGTISGGNQTVNALGHIGTGNSASDDDRQIIASETITDTTNTSKTAAMLREILGRTSTAYTGVVIGVEPVASVAAANTQNWTNAIGLKGVSSSIQILSGATGTFTGAAAFYVTPSLLAGGTLTNFYGLYIPNISGTATVTNQYGIYIAALTEGTTLNYGIYMAGGAAYLPLQVGAKDNTAGAGFKIASAVADNSGGIQLYADDGGSALASPAEVVTPFRSRYLLTVSQSGGVSQTATFSQLRTLGTTETPLVLNTGAWRAAYIFNQLGGNTIQGGAEIQGINQATTLAGNMIVTSGRFSGVDINISGTGSITNNSTCAALLIRSSGTPVWSNGIEIKAAGAVTGILIGSVTNALNVTSTTTGIISTTSACTATITANRFYVTVATANMADGYGQAGEFDLTLTGALAGGTAATSSWVNLAATSVPGGNMICAQNNGIWVATGIVTTSAKMVMGMRMQYVDTDGAAPSSLFCFSTNIYSNVLTAIFDVNAAIDLNWATAGWTGGAGHIPLFRDASAGVTYYVNVYTAAS